MTDTDDLELNPAPTPIERATQAVQTVLDENVDDVPELDARRLAAAAVGASMAAYVPPDRPVELLVSIEHEDGLRVEQTLSLTREQGGTPEVLGTALGHAAASVLAGFHITDDGTAGDDARAAAATALHAR